MCTYVLHQPHFFGGSDNQMKRAHWLLDKWATCNAAWLVGILFIAGGFLSGLGSLFFVPAAFILLFPAVSRMYNRAIARHEVYTGQAADATAVARDTTTVRETSGQTITINLNGVPVPGAVQATQAEAPAAAAPATPRRRRPAAGFVVPTAARTVPAGAVRRSVAAQPQHMAAGSRPSTGLGIG